jgi:hypothetical protein
MESLEKTELIQQLETSVGAVEAGRKALETEFEEAKKSGDFSKFYELQKTVRKDVSKADRDRRILEGENPISEISAQYKNKDTKSEESAEIISLNFENELVNWTDFYNKHGLTLPANFAETMQDIWERNVSAMEKEIAEKGFDKIVFIPASVDSADLKKLEADMTKGYKEEAKKAGQSENDTYWGIEAKEIINTRSGNRIILLHSAPDLTAQSELLKTLDKKYGGDKTNTVDNKAEDFINAGEQMTISEWLILQREIWEKTGVHIDGKVGADGYVKPTWCGGSRVGKGAGSSVVRAYWNPGGARVEVNANSPDHSFGYIGCRLSRCFE